MCARLQNPVMGFEGGLLCDWRAECRETRRKTPTVHALRFELTYQLKGEWL